MAASSPSSSMLSIPGARSFRSLSKEKIMNSPSSTRQSRKTLTASYVSAVSHKEESSSIEDEMSLSESITYTVHIPASPDHQPMSATATVRSMDPEIATEAEQQQFVVSSAMMMMETEEAGYPQLASARGFMCSVEGCNRNAMQEERGESVLPCDCGYKICHQCHVDALKTSGKCPGCKDQYRSSNSSGDESPRDAAQPRALPLPAGIDSNKMERRLSLLKTKSLKSSKSLDFDHSRWLYATKGTYGYGNAVWPKEDGYAGGNNTGIGAQPDFNDRSRRPLSRKAHVSAGILSPYRLLVLIRMVVLGFFLAWRVRNPNTDAMWLWGMSVVCEIWFAFSWVLDQLPKLFPMNRMTDLQVLEEKFERPSPQNPLGRSDLPGMDVLVSTADPEKEPPLTTCNTILSILAADYPLEKLSCYLSDDGGALLTFEALAEAASFARVWVPFCRKHIIEPRNPETYFLLRGDPTKNKMSSDFVKDRRCVKRAYDEYKVRINGLPDVIQRRSNASEPLMGSADEENLIDTTDIDIRLPMLVYVSREKRPGYDHNKKAGAMNAMVRTSAIMSNGAFILNLDCDHYIYNSKALREAMCFFMDRGGDRICYVQFPQRFEGVDPNDRYANHNTVFFDVNMRALDGLQGPFYVGTGCVFRRTALYGLDPPQHTEHPGCWDYLCCLAREPLDASIVAEAINVISCTYEEKTEWGKRVGWIYGSVTEDVVTGFRMHNRGWRSIYCVTKLDAFRGTAPINLTDRLHQVLRWATGSVEIFFSRNNALFASPRMKFLQRVAYLNVGIYPFTSIFLLVYCFLPAFSLISNQFIVKQLNLAFLVYLLTITLTLCMLALLEVKWSGITLEEWWRNEQFWVIGGTSAHLAAVFQGLLKVIAGVNISFTLTSKSGAEEEGDIYADLYVVKWSSLMIPPISIILTNLIAIAIGSSRQIYSEIPQWSKLLGSVFFSLWVLFHLYPFAKGLMGKGGHIPTIIYVWSGLIAVIISLMFVYISPPAGSVTGTRTAFQFF
ncbi:unnamed protein product [Sphagnum jensenii]|uniref:Cellulose synthase-like protein D3 n=1 Tax=Sphagnum jensenii TaxID=128206 RepID=A0ABP0W6Y7_9BRYO